MSLESFGMPLAWGVCDAGPIVFEFMKIKTTNSSLSELEEVKVLEALEYSNYLNMMFLTNELETPSNAAILTIKTFGFIGHICILCVLHDDVFKDFGFMFPRLISILTLIYYIFCVPALFRTVQSHLWLHSSFLSLEVASRQWIEIAELVWLFCRFMAVLFPLHVKKICSKKFVFALFSLLSLVYTLHHLINMFNSIWFRISDNRFMIDLPEWYKTYTKYVSGFILVGMTTLLIGFLVGMARSIYQARKLNINDETERQKRSGLMLILCTVIPRIFALAAFEMNSGFMKYTYDGFTGTASYTATMTAIWFERTIMILSVPHEYYRLFSNASNFYLFVVFHKRFRQTLFGKVFRSMRYSTQMVTTVHPSSLSSKTR